MDIFVNVKQEGFHALGEDQEILADQAIRADITLGQPPDLEAIVVASAKKIVVLCQSHHPVSALFPLLTLKLILGLIVPHPD